MFPLCRDTGTGVLAYSPLARGRLARGWDEVSPRQQQDGLGQSLYSAPEDANRATADAVLEVALRHGVTRAQVALAWVLAHPAVSAPVLGASAGAHLDDAVAALDLRLTPEDLDELEQDYAPRAVAGF